MIPAARTQAAIDLIGLIEHAIAHQGRPADRLVRDYFKARRFAGSKDRAAITEQVFRVVRRRAEWLWRLGGGEAFTEADPRLMVVIELLCGGSRDVPDLEHLFDGSQYGPAILSDPETEVIERARDKTLAQAPDWVTGNYPAWLKPHLEDRFGAGLGKEMAALNGRAPVDLRVNTLKSNRDAALAALTAEGVSAELAPHSPLGLRANGRSRVTGLQVFTGGQVDVQDEGSQLAALMTDARPGQQVVDLCAGGGGKTLVLGAAMNNSGQIYAIDTDRRRLDQLESRVARAGVRNVQVHRLDASKGTARPDGKVLADLQGRADRVLVDAPCSGTGAWRRNPDAKWRLMPDALVRQTERQDRLLDTAGQLVKPGGYLVYVTCSLLPTENEDRVKNFLSDHLDFHALPIADVWARVLGTTCPTNAQIGDFLFLTPHRHGTDGFFVAVLAREAGGVVP